VLVFKKRQFSFIRKISFDFWREFGVEGGRVKIQNMCISIVMGDYIVI